MVSRVNSEYPARMQHNHEMRYAIASVAHAMMISIVADPSKIMGGLHPLSLRTQVLLHIWSSTISPLCSEICSVWAKNELEARPTSARLMTVCRSLGL